MKSGIAYTQIAIRSDNINTGKNLAFMDIKSIAVDAKKICLLL